MIFYQQIQKMYDENVSEDEIKKFLYRKIKNASKEDTFDIAISLRSLMSMGNLGITKKTVQDFVLHNRDAFLIERLWAMITDTGKDWEFRVQGGYQGHARIEISQIGDALIILPVLLDQNTIEKYIEDLMINKKITQNTVSTIFYTIINWVITSHKPLIFMNTWFFDVNLSFLYLLLKYVFDGTGEMQLKKLRDRRDVLLESFTEIYNAIPYNFSPKQFKSFVDNIKKIDDKKWSLAIGIESDEVIKFIKDQYKHITDNGELSLGDIDYLSDENLKKLHVIFSTYRSAIGLKDEIDDFFINHPISLYWQVHMMDKDSDYTKENIKCFMDDHLHEFLYEEMLNKIVNVYVSERIQFAVYIAIKLRSTRTVLRDIFVNFKNGKIKLPELEYLYYICRSNKQFSDGLKRVIDKANLKTKK